MRRLPVILVLLQQVLVLHLRLVSGSPLGIWARRALMPRVLLLLSLGLNLVVRLLAVSSNTTTIGPVGPIVSANA